MDWIQLLIEQYALFCLIGVVVGVLSGLLGIGGGIVLVPMLHAMLVAKGFSADAAFHMALATSMACIVFTSLSSILAHHKNQNIVWPYVWAMVPMASPRLPVEPTATVYWPNKARASGLARAR